MERDAREVVLAMTLMLPLPSPVDPLVQCERKNITSDELDREYYINGSNSKPTDPPCIRSHSSKKILCIALRSNIFTHSSGADAVEEIIVRIPLSRRGFFTRLDHRVRWGVAKKTQFSTN